jgi:hypothetical protein
MTELLPAFPSPFCKADRRCTRAPCFQARLEATTGRRCVRSHAELCADHLGCTVHTLTAWARDQGLNGQVTVLAIDLPGSAGPSPAWGRSGLAFAIIPIRP